jgi:hypothetical protein
MARIGAETQGRALETHVAAMIEARKSRRQPDPARPLRLLMKSKLMVGAGNGTQRRQERKDDAVECAIWRFQTWASQANTTSDSASLRLCVKRLQPLVAE